MLKNLTLFQKCVNVCYVINRKLKIIFISIFFSLRMTLYVTLQSMFRSFWSSVEIGEDTEAV